MENKNRKKIHIIVCTAMVIMIIVEMLTCDLNMGYSYNSKYNSESELYDGFSDKDSSIFDISD